jgi:hypothetical protein
MVEAIRNSVGGGGLTKCLPNYNFPRIRFCKKGHAIVGDNVVARSGDEHIRCRICTREAARRKRNIPDLPEDKIRAVIDGIKEGRTINSLHGRQGSNFVGNKVVDGTRLRAWCRAHPKLGRWILQNAAKNAAKAKECSSKGNRINVAAPALARNIGVLDAINAAIPTYLTGADRDDVIAEMWTAVAEGRLRPADIRTSVRQFVTAHRKMYPTTDRWSPASLDAPVYDDNPTPRIERIAEGQGLWS